MPQKSRTRKRELDQQLVTEFAEFRALESKIEKWLKIIREHFLEQFSNGYVCPTKGPYLLVLEPGSTANIDWKQEFFLRLKSDFEGWGRTPSMAEQLAAEKMVEMARLAGRDEYQKIAVKSNPGFGGKLMRAIVKRLDSRSSRGF